MTVNGKNSDIELFASHIIIDLKMLYNMKSFR